MRAAAPIALMLLAACAKAPSPPGPLVPGLATALPTLGEVRLEQGGTVLVFERRGDDWRIRDAGWRADRRWLQPLLLGLASARCDEPRTADPARFDRIGVAWPAVADVSPDGAFARPTGRLTLRVDGRERAIIIGYPQARGGTFVRVEDAAHSCLSEAALRLPARVSEWFDPNLWRVPIERVSAATVEDPGVPALRLVPGEGGFRPDGALMALTPDADALVSALAAARQRDLRAASDAVPQRVLRLRLEGESTYALAVWREGGATWARVLEAPDAEALWFEGREFQLAEDVARPLWADPRQLGRP